MRIDDQRVSDDLAANSAPGVLPWFHWDASLRTHYLHWAAERGLQPGTLKPRRREAKERSLLQSNGYRALVLARILCSCGSVGCVLKCPSKDPRICWGLLNRKWCRRGGTSRRRHFTGVRARARVSSILTAGTHRIIAGVLVVLDVNWTHTCEAS